MKTNNSSNVGPFVITRQLLAGSRSFKTRSGGWSENIALAWRFDTEEHARFVLRGNSGEVVPLASIAGESTPQKSLAVIPASAPAIAPATAPLDRHETARMAECEQAIERGLDTFIEIGGALAEICDKRLYREQYATFEAYCQKRWDMSGRRARQLCAAAGTMTLLQEGTESPEILPATESQARPLTVLPPEEQKAAWSEAVATAPKARNGATTVTAAHVKAVVNKRRGIELPAPEPARGDEPEEGWPKPNENGVYDKNDATEISNIGRTVRIYLLQIGPRGWIIGYTVRFDMSGLVCPLSVSAGVYPTEDLAKYRAAQACMDRAVLIINKDISSSIKSVKEAKLAKAWLENIIESLSAPSDDEALRRRTEPVTQQRNVPNPTSETETIVWIPAAKLPDADTTVIINTPGADDPVWLGYYDDESHEWRTVEGDSILRKTVAFWANLPAGPKQNTVSGYVICREPSENAIHGPAQKPRFLGNPGGWTPDPDKVKPFTTRDAAQKRARFDDQVMSLETARKRAGAL